MHDDSNPYEAPRHGDQVTSRDPRISVVVCLLTLSYAMMGLEWRDIEIELTSLLLYYLSIAFGMLTSHSFGVQECTPGAQLGIYACITFLTILSFRFSR